jgi:hypothetical protein
LHKINIHISKQYCQSIKIIIFNVGALDKHLKTILEKPTRSGAISNPLLWRVIIRASSYLVVLAKV